MSLSRVISTTVAGMRGPGLTDDDKAYLDGAVATARRATAAISVGAGAIAAPVAPWTPALMDLTGWWDPADRATMTLIDGEVDRIADKSGTGRLLTAPTAGKRPGYDTSFGAPNLVFDGTGRVIASAPTDVTTGLTIFAAIFDSDAAQMYQTLFDAGNIILLRSRQGDGTLLSAGEQLRVSQLLPRDGFHALSGSIAGGIGNLSVDGHAPETGPVGSDEATGVVIRIGDSEAGDAPLRAGLGDVIVAPYELLPSDDLHQRITGYLAWKYNIHEKLDDQHPYRYCPPVTGRRPVAAQVYRGPAMIPHGPAGSWYETNIFDPRVMVDPDDASQLVMYTSGQAAPVSTGTASIGRWTTAAATPTSGWTFDRIVLQSGAPGAWDAQTDGGNGVRLGSVVYRDGLYYLYYASQPAGQIGLATSLDGKTFTRFGSDPVLTPTGQGRIDGSDVSNPYVLFDDGVWHMVYTYRTATETLPGYRYARSTDGKVWTKIGQGDILSRPHRGLNMESVQLLKRARLWYLIFEMGGNPSDATPYREMVAVSERVEGPYTLKKLLLPESGADSTTSDKYHVATPFLFALDGQDYLFWQGGGEVAQPYYNNHWDLFAAQVVNAL